MTFIIYIGSNKEYINHFQELLQENIVIVKNKEEAGIILKELPSNKIQPLLYEKINPDVDKVNIAYLKKKFKNLYIILVTKKIGKEETSIYIEAGANNTISPYADSDVFKAITNFISKNEILNKKERKEKNKVDEVFTIPKGKRIFDIIISLSALIVLSPFLILIMVLIKLESRGPILYKSKRVGSNFYIFNFLKFRSMYIDAEERLSSYLSMNQYTKESKEKTSEVSATNSDIINDDTVLVSDDYEISEHEYLNKKKEKKDTTFFKIAHDPRVTKMGRFMRKYSIDEIPQLINILKGDMSIVGNRPLPLYEAELLTGDEYIERFIAPAGLTGLWQVERRGGEGKMSAEERKQLDIYYAHNYSIWLDCKIIFKTFFSFIQKEDA
ncbi:sugar transferase [Dysgonomonas mossii]|uniref:Sugar transferase n=1 Tax=Dysgonomonas mossii TaxID=163665 RepID=A0A4Y9IRT7_9BACT|nr:MULTISPECIES: sugar transferase [Dysgonomonas]MBF0760370.1 sugar transferase [Dysgonomonas mossii]OJX64864.1 MAG: glycosyl transferase [Dysgonomonas sp. 37-18]TFU91310.1 sugar transferase [Dysgonomonas mossii]